MNVTERQVTELQVTEMHSQGCASTVRTEVAYGPRLLGSLPPATTRPSTLFPQRRLGLPWGFHPGRPLILFLDRLYRSCEWCRPRSTVLLPLFVLRHRASGVSAPRLPDLPPSFCHLSAPFTLRLFRTLGSVALWSRRSASTCVAASRRERSDSSPRCPGLQKRQAASPTRCGCSSLRCLAHCCAIHFRFSARLRPSGGLRHRRAFDPPSIIPRSDLSVRVPDRARTERLRLLPRSLPLVRLAPSEFPFPRWLFPRPNERPRSQPPFDFSLAFASKSPPGSTFGSHRLPVASSPPGFRLLVP